MNDDIDDIYIICVQENSIDSIKDVQTGDLAWIKDHEYYAFVRIEKQKEQTKEIKYKE